MMGISAAARNVHLAEEEVFHEMHQPPGCGQGKRPKCGSTMTSIRRAQERHHEHNRKQELWFTFNPQDLAEAQAAGLGNLLTINETQLSPGAGSPRHPHHDTEIVTYTHEGALAYEDSMGRSGVIQNGEFQRMTSGQGLRHNETNASRTEGVHVFQIGLRSWQAGLDSGYEQKRFSLAERRDGLCVVASPDSRRGSLRIHQDALIHSAILDTGHHLVHELAQGRSAWLHLIRGELALGDVVLTAGDGVGFTAERAVSVTAREEAELLLLDLGAEMPGVPRA
jgi:quercetin 2,3-dioxygenase